MSARTRAARKAMARRYAPRQRPDLGLRPGVRVVQAKHRDRRRLSTRALLQAQDE